MGIRDTMILTSVNYSGFCGLIIDSDGCYYSEYIVSDCMDMLKFIKRK